MKKINKYNALVMVVFTIRVNCASADDILAISVVPVITSEVTSSDKHSLYGFTDKELKAVQFVQLNWSNLTADMAKGQGENLAAIADFLQVKPAQKPVFYTLSKVKFSLLLPSSKTTPEQLIKNFKLEVGKLSKV